MILDERLREELVTSSECLRERAELSFRDVSRAVKAREPKGSSSVDLRLG